jgi:hypothetical protein
MESLLEMVLIISTAILRKVRLVLCSKTTSALVQIAWHSVVLLVVQPVRATHTKPFASVHQGITYVAAYASPANDCFAASPDT